MTPKVLVFEANEITWDLVDPLMRRGLLPNFQALVETGARGEAWANETPELLDPWVTWTTVYTGVPQSVHGLTMLEQDRESLGAPRLWEYLADDGVRVGLFGTANSWPPREVDGFWVPGPFARDFATYPKELAPIQSLNVGLTRKHTAGGLKPPSLKSLIPKLVALGLSLRTAATVAREMAAIKLNPKRRWRMVSLQPLINLDLFARLYRRFQPRFATLHTNHVAYYQHRFWRAMAPDSFEVPPDAEERDTYAGAIEHGYVIADRLLGRLRRLAGPDVNLVVLGSCGAQPATGGRYSEDQRRGHVGLQVRMQPLLKALGLAERVVYSNLMAPQWKIDFPNEELLMETMDRLERSRNVTREAPIFGVASEGLSLRLGAHRNQELDDTLELQTPAGPRRFHASELIDRHAEVVKTGRHHSRGLLLLHGPSVRPGTQLDPCDNLDVAPTIMHLLGRPVPSVMRGRVLEEALGGGRSAELVPA